MEYYTKSEGLGFLIRKSRIDFRIEFRGVSILCEFNPSTKSRYGHNRTHQRLLVSHDQHGLTWPPSNCTLRGGSRRQYRWINVFNHCVMSHKWPHDGATETPVLRLAMSQTIRLLNFTDGQAAKSDTPDTKIRSNEQRGVFNLTQVTEDVSLQGSCILPSRKLSILHGPVWPTKKLRTVRHDPHKNCSGQSLVPFLQTFTNSILVLDFSLVGPRPLYSILGNEESRIFGSC